MSQFSDHDPSGQSVRLAAGLTSYDRGGWRRWLVPIGVLAVALSSLALVFVAVTR